MRCLKCGNINLEPAGSCQVCGAALAGTDPDPLSPEPAATPELPLTTSLYRALLGPVHTDDYLARFARFDAAGRTGISWHWPAFFATFAWLIFRGMWAHALAFFGFSVAVALALFGVLPLLTTVSPEWLWSLAALFLAVECVLPALWANAVFYRHCNRLVTQTLQSAPDMKATTERLAAMAATRRRAITVGVLNALAWGAAVALGAWLAFAGPGHRAAPPSRSASAPLTVASVVLPASAASQTAAPASAPEPPASAAPAPAGAASSAATLPMAAASATALVASAPARAASAVSATASAAPAPASAPTPVASATARAVAAVGAAPAASAPAAPNVTPAPAPVLAKPIHAPKPAASTTAPAKVRKPPAKPKEAASAALASAKRGRFMVAVGQFAMEQNADRSYAKLEAAGLPVHSNTTQTEAGPLLLIRVGPYRTLQEARQAAAQVRKLGLPAVVMRR